MKKLFEKLNYYYKHFRILILVPIAFILIPIFNKKFEDKFVISFEKMVFNYYESSFSGVITKKYIDKGNRDTPTIVLKNEKIEKLILLQFETDSDFNQFKINDTIIKQSDQIKILIKRNGIKLIKQFNFKNHAHRNKYHKSLDTIVENYTKKQIEIKQ